MAIMKYLDEHGTETVLKKIKNQIWRGTQEEWDALSAAEKDKYEQAEIIGLDNNGVVYVADKVESGNMNPVTSNAVAAVSMDSAISIDTTKWSPAGQIHATKVGQLGIITWGGNSHVNISTDVNNRTKVGQLPVGFRPSVPLENAITTINGTIASLGISTDGEVTLCCISDTLKIGNWAWGEIVFVIGN